MSQTSTDLPKTGHPGAPASTFDIYIMLPILAIAYVEIISPLLIHADTGPLVDGMWNAAQIEVIMAPRAEHKIFWPALSAVSIILAMRNWFRLTFPPHIVALFVHLAFAGISIVWAFKPEFSSIRFAQQAMIVFSIIIPSMLANPKADLLRGAFICFALAVLINLFFVMNQNPMIFENNRICYAGYFTFKGTLGECAAIAFMFSLYEISYSGFRRMFGIIMIGLSIYIIILSDSKGALAIAIMAPVLAGLTLFVGKTLHMSPAILLAPVPFIYVTLSYAIGNLINRISWHVYGNYDLSGRVLIWDFAQFEIARRPLLGWGYQSFWLVGPDAPSITEAPGWVKNMPSSHNGYLDTVVELGYAGLVSLIIVIFTTLYAIGRVQNREPARAWLLLTIALYIIITNFIETGWMRGFDMLWVIFLIGMAETGRYWRVGPTRAHKLRRANPANPEHTLS
jgi:exopolysaccharide production protein ExoQ